MELDLLTPGAQSPAREWRPHTAGHTQGAKVVKVVHHHLKLSYRVAKVGQGGASTTLATLADTH